MLPLPLPEPGGSIEALVPLLNLKSRNKLVLTVMWLLATLRSRGPHPVLAISAQQRPTKTVLSKLLQSLIDPNATPVRAPTRKARAPPTPPHHPHPLASDTLPP